MFGLNALARQRALAFIASSVILLTPLHCLGQSATTTSSDCPNPVPKSDTPDPSKKRLQVWVISVTDFDDDAWMNAMLIKHIKEATCELKTFFETKFPAADLHFYTTKEQTTTEQINRLLRTDFKKYGNETLNLVFVLTHGVPQSLPQNQELMIISSNTSSVHPEDKAILGKDFIEAFKGLDRGSVVWAFLDTCHSGAAANPQISIDETLGDLYGTKMMVMASSLPSDLTYQAAFTRALIKIWTQGPPVGISCVPLEPDVDQEETAAPGLLATTERDILKQANIDLRDEEGPRTLIRYKGDICLDTFAAQSGALVFYNTTKEPLLVNIESAAEAGGKTYQPRRLKPTHGDQVNVKPIKVDRGKYKISVSLDTQADTHQILPPQFVDLQNDPIAFIKIPPDGQQVALAATAETASASMTKGTAPDPLETERLGVAYAKTLQYTYEMGMPIESVSKFKDAAQLAFSRAGQEYGRRGDRTKLTVLQAESAALARSGPDYNNGFDFASQSTAGILQTIKNNGLDVGEVALELKLKGSFDKAAELFKTAADNSLDPNARLNLAVEAYFNFGAASKPEEAQAVLSQYPEIKPTIKSRCKFCTSLVNDALKHPEARSLLKEFSTVQALAMPTSAFSTAIQ